MSKIIMVMHNGGARKNENTTAQPRKSRTSKPATTINMNEENILPQLLLIKSQIDLTTLLTSL